MDFGVEEFDDVQLRSALFKVIGPRYLKAKSLKMGYPAEKLLRAITTELRGRGGQVNDSFP